MDAQLYLADLQVALDDCGTPVRLMPKGGDAVELRAFLKDLGDDAPVWVRASLVRDDCLWCEILVPAGVFPGGPQDGLTVEDPDGFVWKMQTWRRNGSPALSYTLACIRDSRGRL
jgi:hypothetical protein